MAKKPTRGAPSARRGGQNQSGAKLPAQAATIEASEKAAPKKRTSPIRFLQEVRAEARKISWPSRKETWITSVMVFIMVLITTTFFAVVDVAMGWGVSQVIKIGG